jgi:hypothetical protein
MALSITPLFSLLQHDFPIPALKGFVVLPLDHERLDMRREVRVPGRRSSQGQSLYLGDHPKPANEDHLKTGQRRS